MVTKSTVLQNIAAVVAIVGVAFMVWSYRHPVQQTPPSADSAVSQASKPASAQSPNSTSSAAPLRWPMNSAMMAAIVLLTVSVLLHVVGLVGRKRPLPYPTVRVFKHEQTTQPVYDEVFKRFADSGWRVEGARTDLPQDTTGIRIKGGTAFEREMAKWGLDGLHIAWKLDDAGAPPPTLEVIVGAASMWEDAKRALERGKHSDQTPNWLLQIADTDIGNLDTYLYWTQNPMMYTRPNLTSHSPYVDLWFGIINASVFTLSLDHVEGHIKYLGNPLPRRPEPLRDDDILRHADYYQFGLRQWLDKPAADGMIASGKVRLDTSEFAIWFRYIDHQGQLRTLRKTFTGDVFGFGEEKSPAASVVVAERDLLAAELQDARSERDGKEQALLTCKKALGIHRLVRFVERVEANVEVYNAKAQNEEEKLRQVEVTIRFVGYASTDFGLAKQIESILKAHTPWTITLDGGNNPALRPSDEFKVIFESSVMGTFREVAGAFGDGRLVDAAVGMRDHANRFDHGHLVIEVLPTAS